MAHLIQSIKENGWLHQPIIVNDTMEVLDGQTRLAALEELRMPVEYIIVPGRGIKECIAMNINTTNWTLKDYIKSYAEMGNESYAWLAEQVNLYPYISPQLIAGIAVGNVGSMGGDSVRDAKFSVNAEGKEIAERILSILPPFVDVFKTIPGMMRNWITATVFAIRDCGANPVRLLGRLRESSNSLGQCATIQNCVKELEKLYNYHMPQDQRVYMSIMYDRAFAEMRIEHLREMAKKMEERANNA